MRFHKLEWSNPCWFIGCIKFHASPGQNATFQPGNLNFKQQGTSYGKSLKKAKKSTKTEEKTWEIRPPFRYFF